MTRSPDVIVIGAGIVGAACALELAEAGLRVTILDGGPPGGGTTAAGMGHVTIMDDSAAQFALTHFSQSLWKERRPTLPDRVEWDPCGTIWVAADDEEMDAVHKKHAWYGERGVLTEVLDGAALAEAEPNLRAGLAGGLRVPGDVVVYPPAATDWMIEQARASGARLLVGSPVATVDDAGVTLRDGTRLDAGAVVVAAGHDALGLLPCEVPGLTVKGRKGHLAITARYPGFARHQLVELGYLKSAHTHATTSVAFNIQPRRTGQMLLGSSRQYDRQDAAIEPAILARMINRALEFMPGLAALQVVRTWTGFRAATEDKLPIIGAVADHPTILLATGHEGLGISTSLATGRLITDEILGREPAIDPAPYRATRGAEAVA